MSQITGTWATRANAPGVGLMTYGCAEADGKIYCMGGYNGNYLNTNYIYDTRTNAWSQGQKLPVALSSMGCARVGRKIYCICGAINAQTNQQNTVYIYDIDANSWSQGATCPQRRFELGCAVLKDKIYAIGGRITTTSSGTHTTRMDIYDPHTDSWTTGASMPKAAVGICAATLNNRIYVTAGQTLYIYDPENEAWSIGANLPFKAESCLTVAWNNKICCLGGGNVRDLFSVYDPELDSWQSAPNMLTGRIYFNGAVVDGSIYCIGGLGTSSDYPVRANEVFLPDEVEVPKDRRLRVVLEQGASQQLAAILLPSGVTVEEVDWSSADPAVVQVDGIGLATGLTPGRSEVTVTAKDGSWSDCILVQVVEAEAEPEYRLSIVLKPGETCCLAASDHPEEAFLWTSGSPGVATVSDAGKVTAVAPGVTIITVASEEGDFEDRVYVRVEE